MQRAAGRCEAANRSGEFRSGADPGSAASPRLAVVPEEVRPGKPVIAFEARPRLAKAGGTTNGPSSCTRMGGRIDSLEIEAMSISALSILSVVAILGGCGLVVAMVVLAIWAVLDNSRRNARRDRDQ